MTMPPDWASPPAHAQHATAAERGERGGLTT